MHKGSKEITATKGATITIRSAGNFCAYGMEGKKRTLILGPMNVNARILRYKLPPDMDTVFVKTEKSTEWTLEWTWMNRSEVLDRTPVEMPVGYQQPETLASQMQRFIRMEISNQAQENNLGSFEEEDDFELDEEILTDYEMTDMEEVEEPAEYDQLPDPDAEKEPAVAGDDPPEEDVKKEPAMGDAVDKETA